MDSIGSKLRRRRRIKLSIRKKIKGTSERPRLSVFRSNTHIYAQLIDDVNGHTFVSVTSLNSSDDFKGSSKMEIAKKIGLKIAEKAVENNFKKVVFDRNGYLYHGRVRAFAEGAREGGLEF
jgi:large subunit ribosomal protein L18